MAADVASLCWSPIAASAAAAMASSDVISSSRGDNEVCRQVSSSQHAEGSSEQTVSWHIVPKSQSLSHTDSRSSSPSRAEFRVGGEDRAESCSPKSSDENIEVDGPDVVAIVCGKRVPAS